MSRQTMSRHLRPGETRRFLQLLAGLAVGVLLAMPPAAAKTVRMQPAGEGQVRAVVVGIDKYRNVRPLKGAAADARDIGKVLGEAGVSDLTVLVDEDATRANIERAVVRAIDIAVPGDLVLLALAGHGAKAPERIKGSEPDGMDDVFLLAGFAPSGRGSAERIVDDELKSWLASLGRKGVDVLFVADVCYGGGLTRSPDFRADPPSYRFAGTVPLDDEENRPVSPLATESAGADAMPSLTFLAAVDKNNLAPEIRIPGEATARGALSYAVARAIDGGRDGPVTRHALFGFARQLAYQYSDTRQTIATEPAAGAEPLERVVFRLTTDGVPPRPTRADPVRLRILGGDASTLAGLSPGDTPFRVVVEPEGADLVWDMARSEMLSGSGDLISRDARAPDIPAAVDRLGAVHAIARLTERNYQSMRLLPNDSRFRAGDVVAFRADGLAGKHLILFNIAGNGMVRFLYPREGLDAPRIADSSFSLPLRVSSPFGVDHVVALVSDARLDDLEHAVAALDGQRTPGKLIDLLVAAQSSRADLRIGMASLFSSPN